MMYKFSLPEHFDISKCEIRPNGQVVLPEGYELSMLATVLERYEALLASDKYFDTRDHLPYLRSVAKGNVLEIGTDVGNSTTALLLGVKENGGHLTSVDIKDECRFLFQDEQWLFYWCDSKNLHRMEVLNEADVVYIDGDHSYEGVKSDIEFSLSVIKPGGLILMHDVLCKEFPGVRQAYDELANDERVASSEIREGSWGLSATRLK